MNKIVLQVSADEHTNEAMIQRRDELFAFVGESYKSLRPHPVGACWIVKYKQVFSHTNQSRTQGIYEITFTGLDRVAALTKLRFA